MDVTEHNSTLRVRMRPWVSAVASGFQALSVRNFRLFWFGQIISLTGTWMQTTAQAWLVLQLTNGSPFALGVVITLQYIPVMLFALFGGVLADHLPKRSALVVTQALLMVQAVIFGVLVATGAIQLWHVYVLAVVQGLITAVDNPIRQAFLYEMVGREVLVNAVGLNSMTFHGARIFGPALAGVIIQWIGIAPSLIANAISFIPVIIALLMMDSHAFFTASGQMNGSMLTRLKEGLSFASRTPLIFSILIVTAFIGTFGFNFTVVTPLVADNVLHTDAAGFGLLSASMGLGALMAAFALAYMRQINVRRMLLSGAVFGVFLGTLAVSSVFWLTAFLFVIVGFTGITCATVASSLLQLNTPEQLRGRVLSINLLLTMGSTPIGGFFVGTVAQFAGVETALLICAVMCVVGVGLAAAYRARKGSGQMAAASES